jgi:streptomycin 6-kinase
MRIEIKKAELNDLDTINHLLRLSKAYWGYDEEFVNKFMGIFSMTAERLQKTTTLLFYVDGEIAGFYGFIINENKTLELDNFFLHTNYIGKGLGRKLWAACCNTAKELGENEFVIWSDPNAENFYIKMGCEKIGMKKSPIMPNRYTPILKYKMPD